MATESYRSLQDSVLYHKVVIDELIRENDALKLRLAIADTTIGELTIQVVNLEDGKIELVVKLADSMQEVGRLGMVLHHQADNLVSVQNMQKSG